MQILQQCNNRMASKERNILRMRGKSNSTHKSISTGEDKNNNKIRNKRVLIYIPSFTGTMDCLTVESLAYILFDCWSWKAKGYEFFFQIGKRMHTQNARNLAVDWAIKNDMDYILWFDDDMVVDKSKDLFTRLLSHNKDIVAPLFFQRRPPYLPLIFKRKEYVKGKYTTYDNILDYPKGLIEVDGVGFGCILTKVDVFRKMSKPYFVYGDTFGEDLYFCEKAKSCGFKIWCDTEIEVGHIGDVPIAWECTFKDHIDSARLFMKQKEEKDKKDSKRFIKKVDIIMPCYHNYEITKDAIESILNYTNGVDYRLILINDGGDKELDKYFKTLSRYRKNIIYRTNKPNIGWIKSINQGIDLCNAPYVLFINNDIEIPRNADRWLSRMIEATIPKDIGACGCVTNYVMGYQNIELNKQILLQEHYTKFLIGFCMLIKKEVIDKIGKLDERFGIGGNDDLDYSIRIRKAGYKLKIVRDTFIIHKGTKSLPMVFDDVEKQDKITRKILIDKWGKEIVDDLFNVRKEEIYNG